MKVNSTALPGVIIFSPQIYYDARGYFLETFKQEIYHQHGITKPFFQDNFSHSKKNVLRGLHYQLKRPQGKLVYVTSGKVLDVIVDIRVGSPTFGQSVTVELSDENHTQVYVPPGFAHGFCVLSDSAHFVYKCTDYYDSASEAGLIWNDPDLNIQWPLSAPILSAKDALLPRLASVDKQFLPAYHSSL